MKFMVMFATLMYPGLVYVSGPLERRRITFQHKHVLSSLTTGESSI